MAGKDWDNDSREERGLTFFVRGVRVLWDLLASERRRLKIVASLIVLIECISLLFPYFLKIIFDKFPVIIEEQRIPSVLYIVIPALFVAQIGNHALNRFVKEKIFLRALINLENLLPILAQKKLLALSMGFHELENTGKKVAKIQKGVDKLMDVLAHLVWGMFPVLSYLTLNVVFVLALDWRLGIIYILPIFPSFLIMLYGFEKQVPVFEEWEKEKELSQGYFCQSIINIGTVQGFVKEPVEEGKNEGVRKHMREIDLQASFGIQWYLFATIALMYTFFITTIIVSIYFVMNGWTSIGTVVFICMVGMMTTGALRELVQTYIRVMRNLFAAVRMKELLDEPVDVANANNATVPLRFHGTFRFLNVMFRYRGKPTGVLESFNLTIEPSDFVALVGKSGEGKTTVVRLLTRMYDITNGSLTLDGHEVRLLDRDWYRSRFAIVQQDVDIFDATIHDNVAYGCPEATDDDVREAVRAASLGDLIEPSNRFPEGLMTEVGERGVKLSGGERQRVGVARAYLALLKGAKVLILDEATSSLDSAAERAIQLMLETLRRGSGITIIAIAHRLSTIRRADKICVIKNGQVAESGTHDELISRKGLYAELVHLQDLGELRS